MAKSAEKWIIIIQSAMFLLCGICAKKFENNNKNFTVTTPVSNSGGCPCQFHSNSTELVCTSLTNFHQLSVCTDGAASSRSLVMAYGDVKNLTILHSNFTNFSFKFLQNFPTVECISLQNNTFQDGTIRPSSGLAPSLEILDLRQNNLKKLPVDFLKIFPKLKVIDLSYNNLSKLDVNVFKSNKYLKDIYMRDNPLWCQEMEWFLDWIKSSPQVTVHERDKINCTYYVQSTSFGSVTFENLIDHCPINCTCIKFRSVIKVYCQNKGYRTFPTMLPDTSSVLHMENNHIDSLQSLVNGSNYITVRFLHVDNNSIDSISILERTDFFNALNSLHISGNRLTQIPTHMIDRMMSVCLDEVKLGNNPWNCECHVVAPFHDLLIRHYQKFKDIDQIRCASDDPYHPNQIIHKLLKRDFCAIEGYINPLDILNVCLVLLIFIIIGKVLYDYRRLKQTGHMPVGPFYCFPRQDNR